MEDGFPLFDPNDEAARQEQRLREYYEEFSANARKRLLAKTIVRPTSVYDVLYPKTRELLLSKNVPFKTDLEEDAKIIRDRLIARLVTNETDLEKISVDFRNSMLARAKIQDDKERLLRDGQAFRKNLIAKNSPKKSDIEKDSAQSRESNIAKNTPNLSIKDSIDKNSGNFRDQAIAKNAPKKQDLLQDSEEFRNNYRNKDLHKNVPTNTDLEKDSEAFRKGNLSKNTNRPQDIDEVAKAKREESLSKNATNKSDLEEDSEAFRKSGLSKNPSKEQDLLADSEGLRTGFRDKDLHKNVKIDSDLEKDSEILRRDNIHKNVPNNSDLEVDSAIYRNNNLAKDSQSPPSNAEEISENKRNELLSKNGAKPTDLEKDSAEFREDDLAKNTPKNSDLEKDSALIRNDDLAANAPKSSDLEADSVVFRSDDLAANTPKSSDLEEDSVVFRNDDLAANTPKSSDLEIDSITFRSDDLAANTPNFTDLETDSTVFRSDDLAANTPNFTDLETDSVPFRSDDLAANTPNFTDLETDSVVFRDDDLAVNTPISSDLEIDSVPFRSDDLSLNVPNLSDLETDSVTFRDDDLAANTPSSSDLIVDSTPFLFNNLASNVPSSSDIQTDSVPFRNDDLSANVTSSTDLLTDSNSFRNDDLSSNVPNSSDLITDSAIHRLTDLAANVPANTNLASDSIDFRGDLLASNTPLTQDLLTDSTTFRNDAKAKNDGFGLIGANVNGAGTSAFLGISRVFTQGIILRELLLRKNVPKNTDVKEDSYHFRVNNLARQVWVPQAANVGASLEYGTSSTHFDLLLATRENTGSASVRANYIETGSPSKRAIEDNARWISEFNLGLQFTYGNFVPNPDGSLDTTTLRLDDKAFSTDRTSPKGGRFDTPTFTAEETYWYAEGYVTENIRLYNLERNSYNIKNLQAGGFDGLDKLTSFAGDEDFQDLVSKTIGSLNSRQSVSTQVGTNTTPISVIIANGGKYFPGGNTDILRPGAKGAPLGSAESMMGKTALGNPFEDEDFLSGRRGVKHIVNTIKSSNQKLAANFDPQNNTAYIVGSNREGKPKIARQRYTIANPYAPQDAGKLVFLIKNYASEEEFSFPPYIQSIQNTENANWNSTNFLGRPEAVYTYNNSSRDASISFFVLTDYAQSVDIGRDWDSDAMPVVRANISKHFTEKDVLQNKARRDRIEALKAKQAEETKKATELDQKIEENKELRTDVAIEKSKNPIIDVGPVVPGFMQKISGKVEEKKLQPFLYKLTLEESLKAHGGVLKKRKDTNAEEAAATKKSIGETETDFNIPTNYSESSNGAGNVYNVQVIKKEFNNEETVCKPEDTINRINTMKRTLMFQPAFFSGDKVDFVRKVEFLSKLTRPAANDTETGFSFTTPPVCHIHLGDWWNHDIIVSSVSFDYAGAPWTLEGGRVQPMWVLVNISFNMVGPFRAISGRPPLATDAGGMYSPTEGISKA